MACLNLNVEAGTFVVLADGTLGNGWIKIPVSSSPVAVAVGTRTLTATPIGGANPSYNVVVQFGASTSGPINIQGSSLEYLRVGTDTILVLGIKGANCDGRLISPSLSSTFVLSSSQVLGPNLVRPMVFAPPSGAILLFAWENVLVLSPKLQAYFVTENGVQLWNLEPFTNGLLTYANRPLKVIANTTAPASTIFVFFTVNPTVVLPIRSIGPASPALVFPDTAALATSAPQAVTLSAAGKDCVTITGVGSSPNFTVAGTNPALPAVLAPGQALTVTVTFTPTAVGSFSEVLPIVTANTTGGPTGIHCSGHGTIAIQDDFYVRDWTDAPTSGDDGSVPSTHPVFYTTSDVWNQSDPPNASPTIPSFNASDQPNGDNGVAGGTNYAFARVRRNSAGTRGTPQTVTANFLTATYGAGSNFQSIGTQNLNFSDADLVLTTPGLAWGLSASASPHFCLAVEISTPNDPLASSLSATAPGAADPQVTGDRKKAQRNLSVVDMPLFPHRRVPKPLYATHYAVIHNPSTETRDVILDYVVGPLVGSWFEGACVEVVGGSLRPLGVGDNLMLRNMRPGEDRWIGLTLPATAGKEGEAFLVHFNERANRTTVNGFGIEIRVSPMSRVVQANLRLHRAVINRCDALFEESGSLRGSECGDATAEMDYLDFLNSQLELVRQSVARALRGVPDHFGVRAAAEGLAATLKDREAEHVAVAHLALCHKLDTLLTQRHLAQGNRADILQNVKWHLLLYSTKASFEGLHCRTETVERCEEFIEAYGNDQEPTLFVKLIEDLSACFWETAAVFADGDLELRRRIVAMQDEGVGPAALQRAHRHYLLYVQSFESGPIK